MPGTPSYIYLSLLDKMKDYGSLKAHEKAQIKDFIEIGKFKNTPQANKLRMRYKLLQYDDKTISENDRAKLLDNMIKKDLGIKFDRI